MRNIIIIFKREMMSYFVSPVAYVVAFIFLFLSGYLFVSFIGAGNFPGRNPQALVGPLLRNYLILILFLCPLLTIKLFSEEKSSGTIELILTSPISALQFVLGKFFAAFSLYALILFATLVYVFFMDYYSVVGPDYGVTFSAYFGLLLLGASMIAIGVFTSSLTQSQVIAAISGFGISLFFLLIHSFARDLDGVLSSVMRELSLLSHYIDFDKGVLDSKNILYYLVWIIFSLTLANKSIESYVWK